MTASSSAVSDFIRSARSICWTRLEIVRKNGAIRPVHCVSACKESCSRHAAARRVDGVALPRRKQFGNLFVLAVFMLVISSAGVGDAAPSVISTPWMRDWAKGEPLRKLLQSSTEPSVGYTWQVPPKYVASEAKLTVVGGCVLDLVTVRNHACALITETIPFYYRDEDGDLKVNQTLSEVKSRYVCWGAPFEDVFNDIDRHAFVQFAEGLGARGTIAACGINQLQEIQCFGSNDPSSDAFGNTISGQAEPPEGKYSSISMGGLHGCASPYDEKTMQDHADGDSLICWGNDRMHQSEVPKIQQESILTRIEYEYVQCGYEHNCALRTDNRVTCWGSSLDQQLNIPLREKATATIEGGEMSTMQIYGCCSDCSICDCGTDLWAGVGARCRNVNKLAVGWFHNCAIRGGCDVQCQGKGVTCTSGTAATWYQKDTQCSCNACSRPHELECWGYNAYGSTDAPPGKFKTVSVSYDYSCGVYAECNGHDVVDEIVPGTDKSQCELANSVICWGRNLFGQVTPPKDICKGADRARLVAEANFNQTTLGTPPPRPERPACVCTPRGCDCLGQMPRLEFQAGSSLRASLPLVYATAALMVACLGSQW